MAFHLLAIGVGSPIDGPDIRYPWAADSVTRAADAWNPLDAVPRKQVLVGPSATKARCESALRRLVGSLKQKDSCVLLLSAPAFEADGQLYCLCADSWPEDPAGTSLAIEPFLASLAATKAAVWAFLDVGAPDAGLGFDWGFSAATLSDAITGRLAVTIPQSGDERGLVSDRKKVRLGWLPLIESLTKADTRILNDEGGWQLSGFAEMFPQRLKEIILEETPNTLAMTPKTFGDVSSLPPLADLAELLRQRLASSMPTPEHVRRMSLQATTREKVRNLQNFRKGYSIPDAVTPSAEKFIRKIASEEVKQDIDATFQSLRESMGWKRKEMEVVMERDGSGFIRTPGFEYAMRCDLDPEEPSWVIFTREVGRVTDLTLVRSEGFADAFGRAFSRVQLDFEPPIDLEEVADRLEDSPPAKTRVEISPSLEYVKLTLDGFKGEISLEPTKLVVHAHGESRVNTLLDAFLNFYEGWFEPPAPPPERKAIEGKKKRKS